MIILKNWWIFLLTLFLHFNTLKYSQVLRTVDCFNHNYIFYRIYSYWWNTLVQNVGCIIAHETQSKTNKRYWTFDKNKIFYKLKVTRPAKSKKLENRLNKDQLPQIHSVVVFFLLHQFLEPHFLTGSFVGPSLCAATRKKRGRYITETC